MSNTTSDNDDLGLTHEYIIAGIVILLFGLLYWFLNSGNSGSSQDIFIPSPPPLAPATVNTEGKAPRQGYPLIPAPVTTTASGTTHSSIKSPSETNLSVDSAIDSSGKKALDVVAVVQGNSNESPLESEVEAKVTKQTIAASETMEVVENKSGQTEPAPEVVPVADDIANNLNKGESPAVIEPDSTNNVENVENNVEVVPTYSLPDGSVVKISANGFEGDLQQLFQNGVLNKPLTYDQIYFDTGSTKINAKSNRQIKVTAALMNAFPKTNILLRGHTDNRGSATDNFQLSLARANSMGLALGALGIDTDRIRVLGMGDGFPLASNNTDKGRKKNRRIEILLQ